jgi:hypothetical protein
MKNNQIKFVSVEESALETVSGGLLNIGNGSLNNNQISLLSDLSVNVATGDILSNILNVLNHVHGCECGGEGTPSC